MKGGELGEGNNIHVLDLSSGHSMIRLAKQLLLYNKTMLYIKVGQHVHNHNVYMYMTIYQNDLLSSEQPWLLCNDCSTSLTSSNSSGGKW